MRSVDQQLEGEKKHVFSSNLLIPTCRFTRKPKWLNDFSPTATVSHADAVIGLFDIVRAMRARPGPANPIV